MTKNRWLQILIVALPVVILDLLHKWAKLP